MAPGLAAIRLSVMARERDRWALGSTLPVEAGWVFGLLSAIGIAVERHVLVVAFAFVGAIEYSGW